MQMIVRQKSEEALASVASMVVTPVVSVKYKAQAANKPSQKPRADEALEW